MFEIVKLKDWKQVISTVKINDIKVCNNILARPLRTPCN